jgi:import inner membrane translocase subunit TIM8
MDALGGGLANVDLSRLSNHDKQELQQFAMNESQKARIQSCKSNSGSLCAEWKNTG